MDVFSAAEYIRKKSLRALAWAWAPVKSQKAHGDRTVTRWSRDEVFRCMEVCRRAQASDLDDDARAAKNCTLPGFDPRRWVGTELVAIHMGGAPKYDDPKETRPMHPPEDIAEEGCPGGWYRCAFVSSLHKYRRGGSEGHRNENLLLSRCTDRLVLEAIDYLEHEEGHSLGYFHECRESDG